MADRDIEEQNLRIDFMTIQIERLRQEIRMENRKFLVSLLIASAALLSAGIAAGIALGHFFIR